MKRILSKLRREAKVGKAVIVEKELRPFAFHYPQQGLYAVRRLIYSRYGGPCDKPEGVIYVPVLLAFLVQLARSKGKAKGWAREQVKELLPHVGMSDEWWDEQEVEASKPTGLTPDKIAEKLLIHEHDLEELDARFGKGKRGILVSIDRPKHIRKRERKTYKTVWQKTQRRTQMVKPRKEYEAMSISRTKPWIAAGFNTRRTWERHGKPVASPDVASLKTPSLRDIEGVHTVATATPSISIAVQAKRRNRRGWGSLSAGPARAEGGLSARTG